MFGFLKKKLGEAISKFSDKAKSESKEEKTAEKLPEKEKIGAAPEIESPKPKAPETKTEEPLPKQAPKKEEPRPEKAEVSEPKEAVIHKQVIEHKKEKKLPEEEKLHSHKKENAKEKIIEHEIKPKEEEKPIQEEVITETPKKKGLFERITSVVSGAVTTTKISAEKFEEMFWDLEVILLENNVAVEVIQKIKEDLKGNLVEKPIPRGKIDEAIRDSLRRSIEGLFIDEYDFMEKVRGVASEKKPVKIMFVGINGSGKTTTIAKLAKKLQDGKLKVVMAAADTFRAAAIHQLQEHADKLGIKMIKHDYGSDPAAVAFDAIKYAEAHGADVVLIDTAGRLHSNVNLVEEMKKVNRIAKPDFKIFIGESITGNDCVEQARSFNEAIEIDGIILSKADIDEKGGAAISVSYITQKPILFIGTGQGYDDLKPFSSGLVIEQLGLAG